MNPGGAQSGSGDYGDRLLEALALGLGVGGPGDFG